MSYIEKHLIPGEQIVYKTGLHWVVMAPSIVLAAIFAAGGAYLLIRAESSQSSDNSVTLLAWVGLALFVIAAVCVVVGYFKLSATEMSVTTKRVVIKKGIGSRVTYEMLLAKVESISVQESVWGRMLGYGIVVVRGTGGTPEPFDKIAHPLDFRRHVEQQIEALMPGSAQRIQGATT